MNVPLTNSQMPEGSRTVIRFRYDPTYILEWALKHPSFPTCAWKMLVPTPFPVRAIPWGDTVQVIPGKRWWGMQGPPSWFVSTFLARTESLRIQIIWNFLIPPRTPPLEGKPNYLLVSFQVKPNVEKHAHSSSWHLEKNMSCDSPVILSQVFWICSGQENGQGGGQGRRGEDPRSWWLTTNQLCSKKASTGETLRTYASVLVVSLPGAS